MSSIQLNACHYFIAAQLDFAVPVTIGKYADVARCQLLMPEPCHHHAEARQRLHSREHSTALTTLHVATRLVVRNLAVLQLGVCQLGVSNTSLFTHWFSPFFLAETNADRAGGPCLVLIDLGALWLSPDERPAMYLWQFSSVLSVPSEC